eukprot:CAMPEP_0113304708 /NCGR_PEP_ID=MMETSP0010_2-20120614/4618_1 /TAXON_ID=216773 ORGANISM="Corethron hystrix, Strain 308" /NCGR_SAMPLE_ID=MMETSP0010_2 /ASSEMBLY_ACC=CAM_ASM_000155 /LENGTH=368 /DNA_ID=CAMNT_0000158963 /DNA_START=206 /DNA_END=1309 /DNA_ORIENTATION=+ /assembly_acc=CAM_ASM_000155
MNFLLAKACGQDPSMSSEETKMSGAWENPGTNLIEKMLLSKLFNKKMPEHLPLSLEKPGKNLINRMLPADVLGEIIEFLPPSYRFVGSVSNIFRYLYAKKHGDQKETDVSATTSISALIRYFDENGKIDDIKYEFCVAVRTGQVDLVQFVVERNRWLSNFGVKKTFQCCSSDAFIDTLENILNSGPIESFHDNFGKRACMHAAKGGHIEMLKWLRAVGCPWDKETSTEAARRGHLDLLIWLRQEGCPWGYETCIAAAKGGHIGTLKWLRRNGCPWWEYRMCEFAAKGGHLNMLIWLREEEECPWGLWTPSAAAEGGHWEVLKWSIIHGCPYNAGYIKSNEKINEFDFDTWLEDFQKKNTKTQPRIITK